jgi:hypothetical protein
VDGVMSELLVYDRRPEDQFIEVRETVSRTVEIVGKSIQMLHRSISLLKLFSEKMVATVATNLEISGKSTRTLGILFFEIATLPGGRSR